MSVVTITAQQGVRIRILAVMSYLGILCMVPLILNRDDRYVYFHTKQGLVLWIWSVIAMFVLFIPGIGKIIFSASIMAILLLSLIGLVSVLLGKAWRLPVVYFFSQGL